MLLATEQPERLRKPNNQIHRMTTRKRSFTLQRQPHVTASRIIIKNAETRKKHQQ
jgi:hypothetical protein